jgi:hypothetical protein
MARQADSLKSADFERGGIAARLARFIMLNGLFRPAALSARARVLSLACACMLGMPAAQAAETAASGQAAAVPFQQYRGWRDEPLQDWREANQRVGEIGGWRTYLREAQQSDDASRSGQNIHGH